MNYLMKTSLRAAATLFSRAASRASTPQTPSAAAIVLRDRINVEHKQGNQPDFLVRDAVVFLVARSRERGTGCRGFAVPDERFPVAGRIAGRPRSSSR
jgi:hypothetical protein